MQNVLLIYDNFSDVATLSGGSFVPALPLNNLKVPEPYKVARTTNTLLSSTQFSVSLGGPRAMKAIVIGPTNLSTAHKYRISGTGFDTGWSTGLARAEWNTLPWDDPDFWTGLTPWDDDERGIWIIHVFDTPVVAKNWLVEIDDQLNSDGYIDLGRLVMGRVWQPSLNFVYGNNGLAFRDNSLRATTLSGSEKIWRRRNPRVFNLAFDYLPDEEMYRDGYDFQRIAGYDGQVFVVPDPDNIQTRQRRSFLATVTRPDPLAQVTFGRSSMAFELKEII